MKTHLISTSGDVLEEVEVDQTMYDNYVYLKHLLFEMSIRFGVKSRDIISLIVEYAIKFGNPYNYNDASRQKLRDINLFLEQCNEAYILRKHHINEEMQYLEKKYKKE